jgi:hypothetical protein
MDDAALCERIGPHTYPFNEREIVQLEGGCKVFPSALAHLKRLIRAHMKSTVLDLASSTKLSAAPLKLELDLDRTAAFDRLRTTVEILLDDASEDIDGNVQQAAEAAIVEHSIDALLGSTSFSGSDSYVQDELIPHLLALLARGRVDDVAQLLKMWKSLAFLAAPGSVASIKGSHLSGHVTSVKVLQAISNFLKAFEIPTRKAISARTGLAENKVSEILDQLNLRPYIPPGTWAKNQFYVKDVYRFGHVSCITRDEIEKLFTDNGRRSELFLDAELGKHD